MQSTTSPGFWRVADGTPVPAAEAYAAWGQAAYPVLTEVASQYHGWITYGDLGERVQRETGIRTRQLLTHWIGIVLAHVVHEAHRCGDAPLTALAVDRTGRVGSGYDLILKVAGQPVIEDDVVREDHAKFARYRCYQQFCLSMPPDGGVAVLTPPLAEARARAKVRETAAPPPTCATCFIQLPASGICDTCA